MYSLNARDHFNCSPLLFSWPAPQNRCDQMERGSQPVNETSEMNESSRKVPFYIWRDTEHIPAVKWLECMMLKYVFLSTACVLMSVQELKVSTVEQLESLLQDARKKNSLGAVNRLEHHLLIKYCAAGVSALVMLRNYYSWLLICCQVVGFKLELNCMISRMIELYDFTVFIPHVYGSLWRWKYWSVRQIKPALLAFGRTLI